MPVFYGLYFKSEQLNACLVGFEDFIIKVGMAIDRNIIHVASLYQSVGWWASNQYGMEIRLCQADL